MNVIVNAVFDRTLTRSDLLIFAGIASFADEAGIVGNDELGQPMASPRHLAEKLGAGLSSVSSGLAQLEASGYIEWDRAWSRAKRVPIAGAVGKIRIILPDSSPQS
jgi:hypothetical protein